MTTSARAFHWVSGLVAVGGGFGVLALGGFEWSELYHRAGVPVAWTTVAAGLAAATARSANRSGRLLVLLGLLILLPSLQATAVPALFTAGSLLAEAPAIVATYLLLVYPRASLRTMPEKVIFGAAVAATALVTISTFFYDPRDLGCMACPARLNLVLLHRDVLVVATITRVAGGFALVAALGVLSVLALRTMRATRPARRIILPMAVPGMVIMIDVAIGVTYFWVLQRPQLFPAWWVALQFASRLLLPLGVLVGLLQLRIGRSRVGEMVVELGREHTPARLRDAVARALGDPTAIVFFWSEARSGYVDDEGHAVSVPEPAGGQATTHLERDGKPLAVIAHDATLAEDPLLLEAVRQAAALVIENERLQAEVRAQLEEVRRSRAHIVQATDAERRRVERDLHDGAQQRMVALTVAVRLAEHRARGLGDDALVSELESVAAGLDRAVQELRDLAHGIYPAELTQEGLAAAVNELAERSPVPVRVSVAVGRFPADVETTAYFVTAEALANAAKHSGATEVVVIATTEERDLLISIRDDGIGGANPQGAGLRGLADRVAAIEGHLDVGSAPGRGTVVLARIPCG